MGKNARLIVIVLFVITALIAGIRLLSGEDDWICQDGNWIKHGAPSAPMPTEECL